MELPTLDQTVLETLKFFSTNPPARFNLDDYQLPFVVGSGNALGTGRLMFSGRAAVFADESDFRSTIEAFLPLIDRGLITQAVVISASGEKDSVWEVELAQKHGLETTLLTCQSNSTAATLADQVLSFRSIAEPYTYNTSTYLGMVLATTGEDPAAIRSMIDGLKFPEHFSRYQSYAFVLPDRFINIAPMVIIKGEELFGAHVGVRAYTHGHARHAKFVHPWDQEVVISLGEPNRFFGHPDHRWDVSLPEIASFGAVVALSYFMCGQIQSVHPPYFMQDIKKFCAVFGPKAYGKDQKFEVIVPAS